MSLKCSIFGHRFGEPVVERSRDESGSEVVITIREIQTCGRCGHRRIVSENKEVTTLETPEGGPGGSTGPERTRTEPGPSADEGAAILEDDEPVVEEAEPATSAPAEQESAEPATDDGIILEDDDEPERAPGEWPEEPGGEEPEWTPPMDPDDEPEPSPSVEPTGEAVTVPEGIFRCPSCGFTTPVESSSLREGDFCPECHTGSLAHESESRKT